MNIEQYCKDIRKEYIYECYLNVIQHYKDYNKITRKQMCYEILKHIKEKGIESLITYDEYEPLYQLCNNLDITNEYEILTQLNNRLLATYSIKDDKYVILDEFEETIKEKLSKVDKNKLKQRQEQDKIIGGIIKAHGLISLEHFQEYLNTYCNNQSSIDFKNIDYYFQFYEHIILETDNFLFDKRFAFDIEKIYHAYQQFENVIEKKHLIAKNVLISIYENNINLALKSNKELYNKLNKLPWYAKEQIETKLLLYTHIQAIIDDQFIPYYYKTDDDLLPFIKKASKNIPSAMFHGLTENQFLKLYKKVNYQSTAKLLEEDTLLFYKLYFGLLEFTNKKYHIQPKLKRIYKQEKPRLELIYPIREYLFNHLHIIDKFIKKNPYHFNQEELNIIHNFKYALNDMFIIMKHDHEYTYVMGADGNFAIKGLLDEIEKIIPNNYLPIPCPMILLPFKDTIIYDGILPIQHIKIEKNLKDMLYKDFEENITYYTISGEETTIIN